MKSRARDTLVVVFVLAGIGLAVVGYFWLSGRLEAGRRRTVAVLFDDVTGLRVGDPVEVQGLSKGKVAGLALDGTRIRCAVALDRDVVLTEDARFSIRSVSYLGSDRYLMVKLGSGQPVGTGYVFEGANEALDLEEVFLKLEGMMDSATPEALAERLKQAGEGLVQSVQAELAGFRGQVGAFNDNLVATTGQLERLGRGLDSVIGMVRPGSSAGRLLQSDELYLELRETNDSLQSLLTDIKKNPKRYFKVTVF